MRRDLGDLLLEERLITEGVLRAARRLAKRERLPVVVVLLDEKHLSEQQIVELLAKRLKLPVADMSRQEIDEDVLRVLPYDLAEKHRVLPLSLERRGSGPHAYTLRVAMADPLDRDALDEIQAVTGHHVEPVIAPAAALAALIRSRYRGSVTRLTPGPTPAIDNRGASPFAIEVHAPITPESRLRHGEQSVTQPLQRIDEEASVEVRLRALVRVLVDAGVLSERAYAEEVHRLLKEDGGGGD